MTAISKYFGEGGANLVTGDGGGKPSLADTLRDIADDLADLRGSVAAIGVALPAFTDPPTAGEMAALRALINQLRAGHTGQSGVTLRTTKV